jgi:hypothetical protein
LGLWGAVVWRVLALHAMSKGPCFILHLIALLHPMLAVIAPCHTHAQSVKDHLLALFDWLVPVSLRFVRREVS